MDMHKNLYFGLLLLALSLFLPVASMAADATNPAGTTIHGDWSGTTTNDNYTNHGTVTNNIDMSQGGTDEVLNTGTVGNNILMSNQDGNSVVNSGNVNDIIMGSGNYNNVSNEAGGTVNVIFGVLNADPSDTGGQSIVTNHGTADTLYGSYNQGGGSTGSHNTVNNFGTATYIFGSANSNDNDTGGENTIENTGTVTNDLIGSGNWGDGSIGGDNTITNSGTVNGSIVGSGNAGPNSSGGGNTIDNSGQVDTMIVGTNNEAVGSSGGSNTITNSGTVESGIIGTYNQNARTSGGSNVITNTGTVNGYIYGSYNAEPASITGYSRGGSNTIRNSGTVNQSIYGSYNEGAKSSGGSNTIRNSGTVSGIIVGSYNLNTNNSGGSNIIRNSGTVAGILLGSYNEGQNTSGGSNTITNSGTVKGAIYGSFNQREGASGGGNTITNSGTVNGSIFGTFNEVGNASGGGNTVNLLASSNVGRDVYGTVGGTKTAPDTLNMFGGAVVGRNVGLFDVFNKRGPGKAVVRGNLNLGGADVNVVMHEFETQVQVDGQVTGATGNLTVDVLGGSEQFEHGKTVNVFSVGEIDTWNSETINESFAEWDLVLLNGQITALFLGQGGGTANQPSGQVTSKDTMARQFNTYRKLLDRRIAKLLAPRPPRDASGSQELSYNLPSKGAATGLAAGEAAVASDTQRWGVWVNGMLSWQSNNSDRARFHGTTYTTLAGVDYTITDRIVAGLAIGNDQSWLNTSFNDGSMTTSGFVAAPYVAFALLDNLILDVTGAVGLAYNRQERNKSTFDFDSDYESVRTMIGSGITYYHLWNNWSFDVGAGFMYANEYAPSYTERGDPNLRNRVRSSDVYVGEFNFTGGVKYYFEYFAPYATVTYLVSPWMTRPDYSNDRDEIEVALGLDIEPVESFTLSLQVSKSFLRRYVDATNVMVALRYQF
ncbi:MAG: hypothetical protein U1E05_26125 [Patescibacteria group bacterium]|nr:hypothetical protein [Patescibacteria group bacterium]